MKKLIAILLLCVSMQTMAQELGGAKFDDGVRVDNAPLVLNGVGLRSILFLKMYVAGLYLPEKMTNAEAVLANKGAKRIALHVLNDTDSEHFLKGFRKGFEKNHNAQEMAELRDRMEAFVHMFDAVTKVKKGDVIALDWRPENGTRIRLNESELGTIAGEDFYRALLSIWIGEKPVSSDLKKGLLGG